MSARQPLPLLYSQLEECTACPRLVAWRQDVAREKRAAYRDETYWGRPVPGFGDPRARVVVVGLAPAAHGANRTGRMFTGDRAGDFLFASLHRTGFANRPRSVTPGDGLTLDGIFITSAVKCAPPANKPTAEEQANCEAWLTKELGHFAIDVIVALGGLAHQRILRLAPSMGWRLPTPSPRFAHGAEARLGGGPILLDSYHPSQQNTFTKRLTEPMLDEVFKSVNRLVGET